MGDHDATRQNDQRQQREFVRALLDDVKALERMLEEGHIESGVRRIGAEQELFLVDPGCEPAPVAPEVLKEIGDPAFTTELARFNLEANLPPYLFRDDCLHRLERDLDDMIATARAAAQKCGAEVVLSGILPTLQLSDLGLDNMSPVPRYAALNDEIVRQRGGDFHVRIKGIDELFAVHDNVMMESCNTSFQMHFQVGADEFARLYNLAQAVTAPVLAAAVNSPLFLERRLWQETRIALFQSSVDARSHAREQRGSRARVRFGDKWVDSSILEIFKDDIARFRVVLATDVAEDSLATLERGGVPRLAALCLHNGTVYRWNRPCYGLHEGKPHLRIENRALPAGPTVIDEVANAAFYYGLLAGLADEYGDITQVMSFADAKANFIAAARLGLSAQFTWIKGEHVPASELILKHLLPLAATGLETHGIESTDVDRYLGVLEERVRSANTGARWKLQSWAGMGDRGTPHERCRALVAAALARQKKGEPVHTWPLAEVEEARDWRHSYRTVGQFMTKDLFTVQPDDLVDLAANLMDWEHIRHVPVEDDAGQLVGLVSHRGLLRLLAQGVTAAREPVAVADIMKTDLVTITPETPTLEALRLMRDEKVACLPVLAGKKLVGIVTERDFIGVSARLLDEHLEEFDNR